MVVSVLAVTASSWGVLMGISPVLQIRRMLRERSSREVSLGYYVILLAGFLLWISYGIAAQNLVLIAASSVTGPVSRRSTSAKSAARSAQLGSMTPPSQASARMPSAATVAV